MYREVDIEKEALSIAADVMRQVADELRSEVHRLSESLAAVEAERDALWLQAAAPHDAKLWSRLKETERREEEYLDFLRSTKQLVAFEYFRDRRRELQAEEAQKKTA